MIDDPTYDWDTIVKNPAWRMAFQLSELFNDKAPLGWSAFVPIAERTIKECNDLMRGDDRDRKDI